MVQWRQNFQVPQQLFINGLSLLPKVMVARNPSRSKSSPVSGPSAPLLIRWPAWRIYPPPPKKEGDPLNMEWHAYVTAIVTQKWHHHVEDVRAILWYLGENSVVAAWFAVEPYPNTRVFPACDDVTSSSHGHVGWASLLLPASSTDTPLVARRDLATLPKIDGEAWERSTWSMVQEVRNEPKCINQIN